MRKRQLVILGLLLLGGLSGCVGPLYDGGPYRGTYSYYDNPLPGYLYDYPAFGYGHAYYWGHFYRGYDHRLPPVIHHSPRPRHSERPFIGQRQGDWQRRHPRVVHGRQGLPQLRQGVSDRQIARDQPARMRPHFDGRRPMSPEHNSKQLRGRDSGNTGERYTRDGGLHCRGPRC
jgi:hypothetical protein